MHFQVNSAVGSETSRSGAGEGRRCRSDRRPAGRPSARPRRWCPAGTRPTAGGPRVAGRRHPRVQVESGQERLFVQEAFLTETASRPTWSCRPSCGPIGRVPAPTPTGPAILKAAHLQPPHQEPNQECPLLLTTGRSVNHFPSRATTRRPRQLTGAAPGVWVELSEADAAGLEVAEGNLLRVTFPQRLSARHGPYQRHPPGVFAPFPYGSWDQPEGDGPDRRRRPSTSSPSPSRTRSPSSRPTGKPDHRFSRWAEGYRP